MVTSRRAKPSPDEIRSNTVSETSPSGGPSPTAAPPPRPPLRRPREGRLIAGVAAGVAEHVGMDVVIVRILFVVATIFTSGFGVAAYALAWILIPEVSPTEPQRSAPAARRDIGGRDPLFWVGIGSLVLGVVWLLDRGANFSPFGPWLRPDRGLLVPLVLIAFGVALWRASDAEGRRRPTPPPPAAAPPTWRPASAAAAPPRPAQETLVNDDPTRGDPEADRDTTILSRPGGPPGTPPGAADAADSEHAALPPPSFSPPPGPPTAERGGDWSPPPVPSRESAVLVRSTLGLALVTGGILWLLRVADVITLGPGRILAATLLVVGLGLLVGSVAGRGRGLIGVGLVLLPIVLIAQMLYPLSFEAADFRQGVGEYRVTPTTIEELESTYQVGAGTLRLDLSELELTGTRSLGVQVGFGQAEIIVPADVTVEVSGQVAGGELTAFGRRSSGLAVDRTIVDEVDDEVGRLELEVQVGFGEVTIRRAPASSATTDDR
jgi:phage shock protein PspC (stress-responsive transcriptional regulator)